MGKSLVSCFFETQCRARALKQKSKLINSLQQLFANSVNAVYILIAYDTHVFNCKEYLFQARYNFDSMTYM